MPKLEDKTPEPRLPADSTRKTSLVVLLRMALDLVDKSTIFQFAILAFLTLLGAALEILSIGMIFPFITIVADPSQIEKWPVLLDIINRFNFTADNQLLIFITGVLFIIFVIKNIILFGVAYVQINFSVTNMALLAQKLLKRYLGAPYSLHLRRNSADLINNVFGSVNAVFANVFIGFVTLFSEILMVAGLAGIILYTNPELAGIALVYVGLAVYLFFAFFRRRIAYWGERELKTIRKCLQSLQQSFHSIKEVKALGREDFLLDSFVRPRQELAKVLMLKGLLAQSPRLWIETIMVAGTLGAVIFILMSGAERAGVIGSLALFAAAGIRVIPSMNKVLLALNRIKSAAFALEVVYRDMHEVEAEPTDQMRREANGKFTERLEIKNISFRYPGTDNWVIQDFSLDINRGDFIGLVGPSGAGKTTLADIIMGLLPPTNGQIIADGIDIHEKTHAWRRSIGYVPQSNYLLDDTLARNIAFGIADKDIDWGRIDQVTEMAQLRDLVKNLPNGLNENVGEHGIRLSGGQRQRIGIARALYPDPDILVFDEATSALDNHTEHEISGAIERLTGTKTLIVIAHRLSTVRKCSKLVLLKDGKFSDSGTFEELENRNPDFQQIVKLSKL
jgi:ATP-binding cassette subfamily C protein